MSALRQAITSNPFSQKYRGAIHIANSHGASGYLVDVSSCPACIKANPRYFLTDPVKLLWGWWLYTIRKSRPMRPLSELFLLKKHGMYYWRYQGGVPLLFVQSLLMRTNTSNLFFPWSINGLCGSLNILAKWHALCILYGWQMFPISKDNNRLFNMIMHLNLI